MSTPVNNIPGLPKISNGDENWMDFINTVTGCYNRIPKDVGAGYYEMYGRSVLMVCKPEYVSQILKNNTAHYLWGGIAAASTCFFGDKVMFVVEDDEWRQLRRVMSPELRTQIDVPKFLSDMTQSANTLADKLALQDGQQVDLVAAIRAFHLSSAGLSMFNVDLKCVEAYPQPNAITEAFAYFLQELPRRSFSQDQEVAQNYTTDNEDNRKMWAASKVVHDIVLEVVRDRQVGKGKAPNDMLNQMVSAFNKEHGKDVSAEQVEQALGANLVELLFAGYNTVVNTIASAMYLLSVNPDVMEKVRAELASVLGKRDVAAQDVDSLKYLTCVFKETLRMYPPAPAIARRLQKDEKIGNMTIPKDAECMFAMSGIHNDPTNWKDPEKFQPERFLSAPKDGTFVPFSDGPRSCIGQHFAKFEFLVTMALLVRKFDFTPSEGYKFGMMFNGFGWMATDMGNMMGGSCVKMQVKTRQSSKGDCSPMMLAGVGLAVAVAGWMHFKKSH